MTLPLILVVDDQYATDDFERKYFLNQTGLVEREDVQDDELPPDTVGIAVFCSGQIKEKPIEGDAYTDTINDYEVIEEAIQYCGADQLSLILVDVQFDSHSTDAIQAPSTYGERYSIYEERFFGFRIKEYLTDYVYNCPPIIMMSAHRQDSELRSEHSAHVVPKDMLSRKEMIDILRDKGQINGWQRARLDLVELVWHIRTIRIDDADATMGMLPVIDNACNELKAAMLGAALTKEGKNRASAARFIYGYDMGAGLGTRDFNKIVKGVESVLGVNALDADTKADLEALKAEGNVRDDNAIFNRRELTDRGIGTLLAKWEKWEDNGKWIRWRELWEENLR